MNVRKFIAANARDALRKVKETLGNDAIILSNRGVPGGVEIMAVAARDMAMIVPTPVADRAPPERRPQQNEFDDDYRVVLNSARARISQPTPPPVMSQAPQMPRQNIAQAAAQKPAGTVNAGIPKNGALRNLDLGRSGAIPVAPQRTGCESASAVSAPAPTRGCASSVARRPTWCRWR